MPVVDLHFVHIPGRVERPTVSGPWYDTAVTMYILEIRWGLVSVGVPCHYCHSTDYGESGQLPEQLRSDRRPSDGRTYHNCK